MKYNFNIIIKRTNRLKTVSFLVKNQEVIISVPKFVSDSEVNSLIEDKIRWIKKKLYSDNINNNILKRKYINGEKFLYFGDEYTLKILNASKDNIYLEGNYIVVEIKNIFDTSSIKKIIKTWYMSESKKYLIKTNNYYEILIGESVNKLLFGEYKSKWGSCNSKRTVSYDWRIIMAPLEVIHYLIIHELCHITHPNHSKYFWSTVEKFMLDYKIQKQWLRKNSNKLFF